MPPDVGEEEGDPTGGGAGCGACSGRAARGYPGCRHRGTTYLLPRGCRFQSTAWAWANTSVQRRSAPRYRRPGVSRGPHGQYRGPRGGDRSGRQGRWPGGPSGRRRRRRRRLAPTVGQAAGASPPRLRGRAVAISGGSCTTGAAALPGETPDRGGHASAHRRRPAPLGRAGTAASAHLCRGASTGGIRKVRRVRPCLDLPQGGSWKRGGGACVSHPGACRASPAASPVARRMASPDGAIGPGGDETIGRCAARPRPR